MRTEKSHLVNYVGSLMKDSAFVYFVSFQGLKVKDISELRNKLAEADAQCHVIKNTLIKKAADVAGIEAFDSLNLVQGTAMVCGNGDASVVAKCLTEFGKAHAELAAKGGYMDGALLSVADVAAIADLPSKDVLRAMLLGTLNAPATSLACLLNAKAATILNVLSAYKDKLESNN